MKNKNIYYICELNLPNSSAYAVHVLKICDALASKNFNVNLIIPSLSISATIIKKNYILKNKINFLKIFKKKMQINFLIRLLFSIKILNMKNIADCKDCIFISRSILFSIIASFFKKNIILELHHELSGMTKLLYYLLKNIGLLKDLRYIFIHKNLIKVFTPQKNSYICLDDAVDPQDFKLTRSVKKIKKTCVYVGSFYPGKGCEIIFNIAKELEDVYFHLYGDKQFLINCDIPKNVKIFNYIKYKDIPKTLLKYDIALMPYGNWISGRLKNINLIKSMSPLKMFDYLASSNIILASDLKIYKHILKHKYNSILIDNLNINEWVIWINKIFMARNKFNYIKRNTQKTVLNYTWKHRSEKIIEFSNKQFF